MTISALVLLIVASARADANDACRGRSEEVRSIAAADQAERQGADGKPKPASEIDWNAAAKRDRERRARIAEIFAEGCLTSADDFAGAALVYQHGDALADYLQAYTLSMKAAALGREASKSLAAAALDRYLMHQGRRQLYASQAVTRAGCVCLWPVEESATDEDRRRMLRPSLSEELDWVDSLNDAAGKSSCPKRAICSDEASPVPHGSVKGVPW
jgi:hypothetical protein